MIIKLKPNVIIINPDQMRADSMGHLGNAAAHTPVLDTLANEGVSFSSAFCQNPVCVPSRCSFFTGLYPHVNGHRTMSHLLHPGEDNMFSDMKKAGYYTISSTRGDLMAGQFPKYHKQLIDEYIMFKRPKTPHNRFMAPRGEKDSDTYFSFMGGIIPTKNPDGLSVNMDDLIIENAIRSIKKRPKSNPFFMFLGLMYPHPTYMVEQKYYDLIDKSKLQTRIPTIDDSDGKPLMERGLRDALRIGNWSEERLLEIRTVYLAMCAKIDDQIGRLLKALKDEHIYDDTAILVFSDHGDYTTDYGIVEKAQNCFPDCLVNVPFLIKPQKGLKVDSGINHNLVELTDVCATVSALTDTKIERTHFSKSLLPTIADKNSGHRDYVFCEGGRLSGESHCTEYNAKTFDENDLYSPRIRLQAAENGAHTKAVMIRDKHYKYVRRLQETDEFYDLSLGESKNLINDSKYKEQISKMEINMLDWFLKTCDTVPKKQDDRFIAQFLHNNITAFGAPAFTGKLLTAAAKPFGKSPSDIIDTLRKLVESGKKNNKN